MRHHVIYIPGLNDKVPYGQDVVIQLWRFVGLRPHYFRANWNEPEGLEGKMDRLARLIDKLRSDDVAISLVAASAGATLAINTLASRNDIRAVVCLCGKVNNPQSVNETYYQLNPDFEPSLRAVDDSLRKLGTKKRRVLSLYAKHDQIVPKRDSVIRGANNASMPVGGHVIGIFFGIVCRMGTIARFVRRAG